MSEAGQFYSFGRTFLRLLPPSFSRLSGHVDTFSAFAERKKNNKKTRRASGAVKSASLGDSVLWSEDYTFVNLCLGLHRGQNDYALSRIMINNIIREVH